MKQPVIDTEYNSDLDLHPQLLVDNINNKYYYDLDVKREFIDDLENTINDRIDAAGFAEPERSAIISELFVRLASNSPQNNLPTKAPALWAKRTTGRKVNPADFIRNYYSEFISSNLPKERRLSRQALQQLDPPLYNAYARWINRHPEDDLGLPTKRDLIDISLKSLDKRVLNQFAAITQNAKKRQL